MAHERHKPAGISCRDKQLLPETVLVVEDNEAENMRLCELVKGFGFSVLGAANGIEALALLRKHRISFIISDWQMPGMNGIELCKTVRHEARDDQPYIIFVTGRDSHSDLIEGLDAGADDFMSKPVNREELRVRMQSGLRLLRLRQEAEQRNQQLSAALEREETLHEKIRDDLKRAAELQRQILPMSSEPFENLKVATLYEAAQELAGDTYNFFPVDDDHLAFFLIDVAGHGVAAAMQSFALTRMMTPETGIFHTAEQQANRPVPEGFDLPAGLVAPHVIAEALNSRFADSDACDYYFTMGGCPA